MILTIDEACIFKNHPNHTRIHYIENLFEASLHDYFDLLWLGLGGQRVHKWMLLLYSKALGETFEGDQGFTATWLSL